MIYADFESILVPENNWKQNPYDLDTHKYQICVGCSTLASLLRHI